MVSLPGSELVPFAAVVAVAVVVIALVLIPVIIPVPFIPIPTMIVLLLAAVALPIPGVKMVSFIARAYPCRTLIGRPRIVSVMPGITIV